MQIKTRKNKKTKQNTFDLKDCGETHATVPVMDTADIVSDDMVTAGGNQIEEMDGDGENSDR